MRRTSANEPARWLSPKAGFTLLEMIFVIAIFSLAIALALPSVADQVSRADRAAAVTEFRGELARLRADAHFRQAEVLVLNPVEDHDARDSRSIELKGGWRAVAVSVLRIDEAGRCDTDAVELKKVGRLPVVLNRAGQACDFVPR
jgi:prepilin-type N-terminal cleavage/methylation domain-containing protein